MTPADKKRQQTHRTWENLVCTPEFAEFLLERDWEFAVKRRVALPHDDGAEQALLGALIFGDDDDWAERNPNVLQRVRPHHFYWRENATIYIAVARVYQSVRQGKSRGVDVVEVASELRRAGKLTGENESCVDSFGQWRLVSVDFLFSLGSGCPSTVNVLAYTNTVLECARLRKLYELGAALEKVVTTQQAPQGQHDYSEMGGQPLGSDPAQIINALRRALDEIETHGTTDTASVFNTNK